MDKNDGGPAFPVSEEEARGKVSGIYGGMSLRDYFVAKMPLRIVGDGQYFEDFTDKEWCEVLGIGYPETGYTHAQFMGFRIELEMRIRLYRADAMLKAREL